MNEIDELAFLNIESFVSKVNSMDEIQLKRYLDSSLTLKEIQVLYSIDKTTKKNCNNVNKVSEMLGVTPSTLSISISHLIKKGFVNKVKDRNDARVSLLLLTTKGISTVNDYVTYKQKLIERLLRGLSDKDKILLIDYLSCMTSNNL